MNHDKIDGVTTWGSRSRKQSIISSLDVDSFYKDISVL